MEHDKTLPEESAAGGSPIQWHPGFYSAFEREFRRNRKDLIFDREVQLTSGPLSIDLLVIKLLGTVSPENEIGGIFRRYNIVEFKSPGDSLSIDDFYKTVAYACLYKSSGQRINEIPAEELTVTLVRSDYPRELVHALTAAGLTVRERFSGIYYLEAGTGSLLFPTQLVVTSRLNRAAHSSLRVLTRNAEEADVRQFLEEALGETEQGDKAIVDSILQVSVSANMALYEKIRRDDSMCQAMRELMKDEIARDVARGRKEGRQEGRKEGRKEGRQEGRQEEAREAALRMLHLGRFSIEDVAFISGLPLDEVRKLAAN